MPVLADPANTLTVRDALEAIVAQRRIPQAAYRFQINHTFTLDDARKLIPYLERLGISDCYTSPLMQAAPGSMHGYDQSDPTKINDEIGGEVSFDAFSAALKEHGMGLILDIVPNHMGITDPSNRWWRDVLEHGPDSEFASYFDIDWNPVNPHDADKVLLPCLGDQYGIVLEKGDIRLVHEDGDFQLACYEQRLPLSPKSRALLKGNSVETTLQKFNGDFDALDVLINLQFYRLAFWRVAADEINYRRFFDINELAAIHTENPAVFQATHQLLFRLLAEGKVNGVRVDHPDGLWNPTDYFRQLQSQYLLEKLEQPELSDDVIQFVDECETTRLPLYVVAEKILSDREPLPHHWKIHGTTGYEFIQEVNGIFVDQHNAETFSKIYETFSGETRSLHEIFIASQRMILQMSMSSELTSLAHQLHRICERNRKFQDFTLHNLTIGIREVICGSSIYRTYLTGSEQVDARDQHFIEEAVEFAKKENPRFAEEVFTFLQDVLLLENLDEFSEDDRECVTRWVMKFQQLTGPVFAKSLEDTSFYIYNRLVSLNEVGGNPSVFGVSVQDFHEQNRARFADWPHSMLTTSTHDTKRSEDVRARLNVLSEMPQEWEAAVTRWCDMNVEFKSCVDANDEWMFYQNLIGVWPSEPMSDVFAERMAAYMLKATREAKRHTSWLSPHEEYDRAVREFVMGTLSNQRFLADVKPLAEKLTFFGYFNSLSQLVLKLTSPGVPDVYQGNELWDFSLVDPDNRRPVDYELRQTMLSKLESSVDVTDLLSHIEDGAIKLYTTWKTLNLRRDHDVLFRDGDYQELPAHGSQASCVCAFTRRHEESSIVVVVPRLIYGLTNGERVTPVGDVWIDTTLTLPTGSYRSLFTGDTVEGNEVAMSEVLKTFPIAILVRE